MDADRETVASPVSPPAAADSEAVQRAVEQFIERHARGEAPDLAAYVASLPEARYAMKDTSKTA